MIRLGIILLILLIVGVAFQLFMKKVVVPYQRDQHLKQLDRENKELDELNARISRPSVFIQAPKRNRQPPTKGDN